MTIQRVNATELLVLRQRVLRPAYKPKDCHFEEDEFDKAIHLAYQLDENLIGCLSLFAQHEDLSPAARTWRLRGMAVLSQHQNKGIGATLLIEALKELKALRAETLWCNARLPAVNFYQQHGFDVIGEAFDIPTVGPHYRMIKTLAPSHA